MQSADPIIKPGPDFYQRKPLSYSVEGRLEPDAESLEMRRIKGVPVQVLQSNNLAALDSAKPHLTSSMSTGLDADEEVKGQGSSLKSVVNPPPQTSYKPLGKQY